MNNDGTNQTRLTKHGNADFYPIWSPDNSQIVFSRGSRNADVYKMNADGSNSVRLTHEPGFDIALIDRRSCRRPLTAISM